jgi:hypothetical protein
MHKIFLFFAVLLLAYQAPARRKDKSSNVNLTGKWSYEWSTGDFDLTLKQKGSTISGYHCGVMYNGNRIDCFDDTTDVSIKGRVKDNVAFVTFHSFYSDSIGEAKIILLSPLRIEWVITKAPGGDYFVPNKAFLKRSK